MFSINPLIHWVGLGVLSITGLATSLRAIDSVAEAMPSRTPSFTLPTPETDDLSLPLVFRSRRATILPNARHSPEPEKRDTSPLTSINQTASPLPTTPILSPAATSGRCFSAHPGEGCQ